MDGESVGPLQRQAGQGLLVKSNRVYQETIELQTFIHQGQESRKVNVLEKRRVLITEMDALNGGGMARKG